ncbi:MAG TPA: amino acid ABC transporter permease [Gemmatimonadaceae bacterium]|nr:amino acid ABC transporter permease [Gemmatimonadaceae bacterium]
MTRRVITIVVIAAACAVALPILRWGVLDATWSGTAADCRSHTGACWAFIGHKLPFMLFGLYPAGARWRAAVATAVLLALIAATGNPRCWRRWLALAWAVGLPLALWLLRGGAPTQRWGGLPITVLLTTIGLTVGMPIGTLLALARRSRFPLPRAIATTFIEVTRGIPLIAVLYVAVLIVPLALPPGITIDKLFLAQVAVVLFASAYLAEAVRSGLQIVPRGRMEAALALGLGWWQAMRLVILPEALRTSIPAFISIAVGLFQDTSLIVIIGLFDLLNTSRLAAQDPSWLGFSTEAYLFAAAVYLAGSGIIVRYGRWLEQFVVCGPRKK